MLFQSVCFIGMGLIGSSLARRMRRDGLVGNITCAVRSAETRDTVKRLGLADAAFLDIGQAVTDADLVMVCAPVGANKSIAQQMTGRLKPGCIVSDVGSVKSAVIADLMPCIGAGIDLVPGHPVAGTEHSGPEAGFAELFEQRWCILTPLPQTRPAATAAVRALWEAVGMKVEEMAPQHHDLVLGMTSHLPHLIAYSIVGTAQHLEDTSEKEVTKFSAGGFRDFTRIAASDPVMWRDVFLNNRDAMLELLGQFQEDLIRLQHAIRWQDGAYLEDWFNRTRTVRRAIVETGQDYKRFSAEGEVRKGR